jgi:N-acetylglucosamine-6-phosphate deacetylase
MRAILASGIWDGTSWAADAAALIEVDQVVQIVPRAAIPRGIPVEELGPDRVFSRGFIDLQVNGGGGVLFNDDPSVHALEAMAAAHRATGTVGLMATLITDEAEKIAAAFAAIAERPPGILGLHLEGPHLNARRAGAHRADLVRLAAEADLGWLSHVPAAGHVMMTLAPESVPPGFIARLVAAGVRVSAGHSEATPAELAAARAEGLSGATHLFNAMPPLSARAPGVAGAALLDPAITCSIIADRLHVDDAMLALAYRLKGPERLMLVSDAMPTVGSTMTDFVLAGRAVHRAGDRLLTAEGTLAGAHLDMAGAVRGMMAACEIPLVDALRMATTTPARWIGVPDAGLGAVTDWIGFNG